MRPTFRRNRRLLLGACALLIGATALLGEPPHAQGEEPGAKELAAMVKKGEALWRKSWRPGAKACFACHLRGPNRMTAVRLKSYPKYDKSMRRVVTGQEKLAFMIRTQSGGPEIPLGNEDLTALEAYISTLR